jgi:hypothetical protein
LGEWTQVVSLTLDADELASLGVESSRPDLAAAQGGQRVRQFDETRYRLLFQIEAEPAAPGEIGDLGRLYVLVPEEDLRLLRFDRTVACVQSS